jgi:hypothetical protein
MSAYEFARYRVEPEQEPVLLDRWPAAVAAIRDRFPGLVDARLARLDDGMWMDVWEWESLEAARTAAAGAPSIPEAAAMFAVIAEPLAMEHGEVVRTG